MAYKFDFRQILIIVAMSYGLLFVFSGIGLLSLVINLIPPLGSVELGAVQDFPIASLIAIVIVAIMSTLMAVAINVGIETPKIWSVFIILAIISAAIWVFAPQLLPRELQFVAGSAQSLFTGTFPQSVLMIP